MFDYPQFSVATSVRSGRVSKRARLSQWLLAGAGQFLQLNNGSFVIVDTCTDNVRRVADPQCIANFTRALFFARFWPPLDPYAGGVFVASQSLGNISVPLVPFNSVSSLAMRSGRKGWAAMVPPGPPPFPVSH